MTAVLEQKPSSRASRSHAAPAFSPIRVVEHFQEMERWLPAWESLVRNALEPNVFHEPWMLLPALRQFAAGKIIRLVLCFVPDVKRPFGDPLLVGLFPLEQQRGYKGLPLKVIRIWHHEHSFLGTPLLHKRHAKESLNFFMNWLATDSRSGCLMEFPLLSAEGPVHQHLIDHFQESDRLTLPDLCHTRALWRPRANGEAYIEAALAGKHRRDFKRLEKRLGELGQLRYTEYTIEQDIEGWIQEFLELETRGWKGRGGSAIGLSREQMAFFAEAVRQADVRGQLLLSSLRLNDKSIAMKCSFRAGSGSFAYKIAFDEELARYSPGVLLEMDNIRRLHALPGLEWMDSCAIPDHSMINRLWLDRRTIVNLLISTGRRPGDLAISGLPLLRWIKRKISRCPDGSRPGTLEEESHQ